MEILLFLLLTALLVIYWLIRNTFTYWSRLGVVQFPVSIPHGNIKGVGKNIPYSQIVTEYYRRAKALGLPFCGLYAYTRPVLLVTDLDLVRTILVSDFSTFPNHAHYSNEKDDKISAHLLNLRDDEWRQLRQKISPTFTKGKLKMVFETVSAVADRLVNAVFNESLQCGQVELEDLMSRFTIDVIGTTAFGIECNSLQDKNSDFFKMGTKLAHNRAHFFKRILKDSFQNLSRMLRIKLVPEEISNFYMGITKQTVEYREKNPQVNRQDFLNLLIQLKSAGALTMDQIAAQSYIFFLAGYETSSNILTFCMLELSLNEDIQEKARMSVVESLTKYGNKLTFEAINDMQYLDLCLNETLRKHSAASNLQRVSIEDYRIPNSNIELKKGQSVWIPIHAIHHDETVYPNPEIFDPERFRLEEVAKRHPFAFLPFGEGPRQCIAQRYGVSLRLLPKKMKTFLFYRFGVMEMKIALAKLLTNFQFTLDHSQTSTPLKISATRNLLTPGEKIYLNIRKLEQQSMTLNTM